MVLCCLHLTSSWKRLEALAIHSKDPLKLAVLLRFSVRHGLYGFEGPKILGYLGVVLKPERCHLLRHASERLRRTVTLSSAEPQQDLRIIHFDCSLQTRPPVARFVMTAPHKLICLTVFT